MIKDTELILYSFGSGSSGNCYYLKAADEALIIDVGISMRRLKKYLSDYGLSLSRVKGILVSHSHTDHVRAVGVVSSEGGIPVYSSTQVHEGMEGNFLMSKKVKKENRRIVQHFEPCNIGNFQIEAFPVPHDSNGNNGYMISWRGQILVFATDVGEVTSEVAQYMAKAHHLVTEANYDEQMLENGPYSPYLKRRIRSGSGHLCNVYTAQAITRYCDNRLRNIFLCHLSEENNHPEIAVRTVQEAIDATQRWHEQSPRLLALKRRNPMMLELQGRG